MINYDLTGKVCVVTGGGSGIGRSVSFTLARSGGSVAVCDRDEKRSLAVAEEITQLGGTAVAFTVDVSDENSVGELMDQVIGEFGRFDVGVNNAGIGGIPNRVGDYPTSDWREVLGIDLDGVFYCTRAEIRALRDGGHAGSIINMSSILGSVAYAMSSAYITAKHGVIGLSKAAAIDHAQDGIRVNAVGPAFVETPALTDYLDRASLDALGASQPIGRLGRSEEVAELVAWLASDASSFCTGGFFPIDGGYLAV